MNKQEINIFDLVMVVLHKWWVVLIFMVIFIGSAIIKDSFLATPMYTARGSIYITVDNSDKLINSGGYTDLLYAQELVDSYIEILSSNTFYKSVSAESGLDYGFGSIASMISISAINETEVLEIRCTNSNPEHAAIIVETVLNNAQSEVARVITGGSAKIIDHPEVPSSPSSPNVQRDAIVYAFIGILISAALIIVFEVLDDRVKDPFSLKERFDIPILSELPTFAAIETDTNK